jgi:adenosylcobinamide kinase/adenosylcobinamide-phosphate guanylyltransferase
MHKLTLILGGARSGKSDHAQRLAEEQHRPVLFIATAEPLDDEMRSRIAAHKQRRPEAWETLELPTGVGRHLLMHPRRAEVVILDCLTLLVSNRLLQATPDPDRFDTVDVQERVQTEVQDLLQAIDVIPAHWLVVSNEVGQGIVPAYPAGRQFRDLLGWSNIQLARRADEVFWMLAGIPVPIADYRPRESTAGE